MSEKFGGLSNFGMNGEYLLCHCALCWMSASVANVCVEDGGVADRSQVGYVKQTKQQLGYKT